MIASGQAGSAPVTAPNVSSAASQTMCATPDGRPHAAGSPEPSLAVERAGEEREAQGGAEAGGSEGVEERAAAVPRRRIEPRRPAAAARSAERQAQPEAASESAKPRAAVQNQAGSRRASPRSPRAPGRPGAAASRRSRPRWQRGEARASWRRCGSRSAIACIVSNGRGAGPGPASLIGRNTRALPSSE